MTDFLHKLLFTITNYKLAFNLFLKAFSIQAAFSNTNPRVVFVLTDSICKCLTFAAGRITRVYILIVNVVEKEAPV